MSDYATKADLDAMEQRIDGKLDALEQRMEGKLDAMEARINDSIGSAIHESETRLLKAIYSLVESVNKRMAGFELAQSNFMSRLSTLETRVTEVEKRLNLPPAA
jgi:predicted  nucleic acid-binding Zn-ribbon protein